MDKKSYLQAIQEMAALPEEARGHLEEMVDKLTPQQRQKAVDELKAKYPAVEEAAEDLMSFYEEKEGELAELERDGRKIEEAVERQQEEQELDTLFDS